MNYIKTKNEFNTVSTERINEVFKNRLSAPATEVWKDGYNYAREILKDIVKNNDNKTTAYEVLKMVEAKLR